MTTMEAGRAPERSHAQRMDALRRANAIRTRRKDLKWELATRPAPRARVAELIESPPEWLDTMHVFDLLLAIPKWGGVKVNRLMATYRMSPSKTVGGLSCRQRDELRGVLLRG